MKEFDEIFMREVYNWASKSKDPRTKIGAVLVKDQFPISTGYNGFPKGVKDLPERYLDKELKYKLVVHAEANSVIIAAQRGVCTKDSILYTSGIPCNECAKHIINGGIKEIVVHAQWPNLTYSEKWVEASRITEIMLKEAGIPIRVYNKVLGIKGFLDGKEIDV